MLAFRGAVIGRDVGPAAGARQGARRVLLNAIDNFSFGNDLGDIALARAGSGAAARDDHRGRAALKVSVIAAQCRSSAAAS